MLGASLTNITLAIIGFLLTASSAQAVDGSSRTCTAGCGVAVIGLGPSYRRCEAHRAGYPNEIAWYAALNPQRGYDGYYVGGGAPLGAGSRCADEGTWGWDYFGRRFRRLVELNWWHDRRSCANREGSYATD